MIRFASNVRIPMVPMGRKAGLKEKRVLASSSLPLSQSIDAEHTMNRAALNVMLVDSDVGQHKNNANDPATNTLNLAGQAAFNAGRSRSVTDTLNLTQYVHAILEGLHVVDRSKYDVEAGVDLSVGQPVYISSNNQAKTANATPAPPADYSVTNVIGLVLTGAATGNTATILTEGHVELDDWTSVAGTANLSPGEQYYLDTTAGQLTTNAPTENAVVVVVGRAVTVKKLDIEVGSRATLNPFLAGVASSNMNLTHNTQYTKINPFEFISQWNTAESGTSNSQQIQLPLISTGNYDFIVEWGDGNDDNITAWDDAAKLHTYNSSGNYSVVLRGTMDGFRFADGGDKLKITNIQQWGGLTFAGAAGAYFQGCANLTSNATDAPDLSGETNLNFTFKDCSSFNGDLSSWNTSTITAFNGVFDGAEVFNQNIGSWNTHNVASFSTMFNGASAFNQNIGSWNTINATNMTFMFQNAVAFNQSLSWNMSNVTSVGSMFNGATSFNGDLPSWNVHKVSGFAFMFNGCTSFNRDLSWNTVNATSFQSMFEGCTAFNGNLSGWSAANVTKLISTFRDASSFNGNITTWNTHSVTNMLNMFYGCTSFNQDISSWNTHNASNMGSVFQDCAAFDQDISSWNTHNATGMPSIFRGCTVFDQSIGSWNTNNVTNMQSMLRSCAAFDQNIGGWDVTSVTSANDMFDGATLSTANYDALLTGWEAQAVQNTVQFHGGSSQYSAGAPTTARTNLISDHSWTITDGGQV